MHAFRRQWFLKILAENFVCDFDIKVTDSASASSEQIDLDQTLRSKSKYGLNQFRYSGDTDL